MQRRPTWLRIIAALVVQQMLLQSFVVPALAIPSARAVDASEAYAGEPLPVDVRTGAVVLAMEDFQIGHDRLPLALGRVYRSDMDQSEPGIFGNNWHSILDMQVVRDGETLSLRDEEGRLRIYTLRGDGLWISQKHDYEALRRNENGEWERHLKSGVVYRFGKEGHLVEITDPNGRFIRITRLESDDGPDGKAQQSIRLEDRYGRHITVVLGEKGRALTASDSTGRHYYYLHDESSNLQGFINHVGGAVAMTYDAKHRLTELSGAMVYNLTYGKGGRITSQRTDRGIIARYDYTLGGDGAVACQITDAVDGVSHIAFAADGQVTATDPTGISETLWLNERELPVKVVGADGQTVEIRYDQRANPIEVIHNGTATRLRHAPDNTLTAVENDTGETLAFAYDERRNVTAVENQRGARSVFEWDRHGLLRSAKGPAGPSVELDYDAYGQVKTMRTGDGQTVTLNFDALGMLRALTTPTGVDFRYAYDREGRLTGVENSEGERVRLERDEQGRVVRVLDAAGNLTRMDYDPAGLLTLVRDPVGAVTRLDYDALGRPEAYTDSNDNVTRWNYDAAGRLLSEVDALGEAATLDYDAQGRLSRHVNRRGQATAVRYDAVGRLTGFEQAGEPATFAYDAYGRSIGMSNADSDFALNLTPEGLIERVTDRKAGIEVAYEYDAAGRRIGMTAGDERVRYAYDAHGRLSTIASSAGRISFEYDAFGRRSAMQYPNGVRTTYAYDKLNRIVEIRAVAADGQDVSRFRYTYDVLGNRTQMIEGEDRYVNYTYDAASRLVRVTEGDQVTEYIYDDVGNRISVLVNGVREDYFTGADNRLLKAGNTEYEYDADGNMTARTTADGQSYVYRYDAANRLIGATGPEGTASYAYAPNGARVARTEDGDTTRFVFDQEDVVFEVVDGKVAARYLHGPGIDEPLALKRGDDTAFYHADALGSIHRLSGAEGGTEGRYRYDAFGRLIEADSTIANTFTYTGREWDPAADLYFYRARFFNPDIGRFTAKDPLGFVDGANQYAYCINNPVKFVDPSGTSIALGVIHHWGTQPYVQKANSTLFENQLEQIGLTCDPNASYAGFGSDNYGTNVITRFLELRFPQSNIAACIHDYHVGSSDGNIRGILDARKPFQENLMTGVEKGDSFFSKTAYYYKFADSYANSWIATLGPIAVEGGRRWDRTVHKGLDMYVDGINWTGGKVVDSVIWTGGKAVDAGTKIWNWRPFSKSTEPEPSVSSGGHGGGSAILPALHFILSRMSDVDLRSTITAMGGILSKDMDLESLRQLFLETVTQHYGAVLDPSPSSSGGTYQSPAPLQNTPYQWPAPYKWPAPLRW